MFECSDSMSYYGQETTCMVPIVIGKCDYSYFLEFGYSFFIVGAKHRRNEERGQGGALGPPNKEQKLVL